MEIDHKYEKIAFNAMRVMKYESLPMGDNLRLKM